MATRFSTGPADRSFDLVAHGIEGDSQRLERLGGDSLSLRDEPEEKVLGADEAVIEQARFFLRQYQDAAGPIAKPLEHCQKGTEAAQDRRRP
jgi:hypothetical protein